MEIGSNGVEEIVELPLKEEELDQLLGAAESVKKKVLELEQL